MEAQLHMFQTQHLMEVFSFISIMLYLRRNTAQYSLFRSLGGPQITFCSKQKRLWPFQGSNPDLPLVQPLPSQYAD
jgi:hypothetical protein